MFPGLGTVTLQDAKSLRGIVHRFADKTSLQGVRYIEDAEHWWSRAIWTALFLSALAVSAWQLYQVFEEFRSYPVSTKIELGYDTLDFPSVTICNINPLRMSRLHTFPEMEEFVKTLADRWKSDISPSEFNDLMRRFSMDFQFGEQSSSEKNNPNQGQVSTKSNQNQQQTNPAQNQSAPHQHVTASDPSQEQTGANQRNKVGGKWMNIKT